MPAVIVNEDRCQSSQICVAACPYHAIGMVTNEQGRAVAQIYDTCIDCLLCVPACPEQAITLVATYGIPAQPEVYDGIWAVVPDASLPSRDFVAWATRLAQSVYAWSGAVLLGADQNEGMLLSAGADMVVRPATATPEAAPPLLDVLVQLVDERHPQALLFADTPSARELAARLAGRLETEVITSMIAVEEDLSKCRLPFQAQTTENNRIRWTETTTTRPRIAVLPSTV
jgi:NAD-dependent dihydropyrimidine dehydrogenase PreA subunit